MLNLFKRSSTSLFSLNLFTDNAEIIYNFNEKSDNKLTYALTALKSSVNMVNNILGSAAAFHLKVRKWVKIGSDYEVT